MRRFSTTDGASIAVHDLGGSGRPLLLAHATGFHGRIWHAVADHLPDRRVYALDFRGYGDSTAPDGVELRWEQFGLDVATVVDGLGLTDVQAVGHSKGGAALLIAALAAPEAFASLVCFEPIVFPGAPPADGPGGPNPLAESARRRRADFDSVEAAIERFGAKSPLGALHPQALRDYVVHGFRPGPDGGITLKARPEHEAATYDMGSRHDTFTRLGALELPVLVVHGDDAGMPAMIAPRIAEALPHGEVLALEGVGHFGPLEDPARFAAIVRERFADTAN